MSVPSWVGRNVQCVCTDGDWVDVFDAGAAGPLPEVGETYTIAETCVLGDAVFVILKEGHVAPDLYALTAFRPLTRLEKDVALFRGAVKGAAASQRLELVPAS